MMAWEEKEGPLKIVHHTDQKVRLGDGKGGVATIRYHPPNEPNVRLGYRLCPDGNQVPHFEKTLEAIQEMCNTCAGAYLTEQEAHRTVTQWYVPKLSYAMHPTRWSQGQCGKIDAVERRTFLPPMRLNRNYPGAVLYGMAEHGGLEFPNTYTLQDQVQFQYLVK